MIDSFRPIYLDCDTGIDDALALAYLINSDITLVGVGTVSGNTSARIAASNTTALLALAGASGVPVAEGEHDPRGGFYQGGASHVHGSNGIGDVSIPAGAIPEPRNAAELLIELSHQHAGDLDIVAIGPLTNIARALDIDPSLPQRIRTLVVMGGAVWVPGNITPTAEANIANDAAAADIVFSAGFAITLVPLDVTTQHGFVDADAQALIRAGSDLHVALGRMLIRYIDFYETIGDRRFAPLHDPLAAAIAVGEIVPASSRRTGIAVDVGGTGRGTTRPDGARPAVDVITGATAATSGIILNRILASAHAAVNR